MLHQSENIKVFSFETENFESVFKLDDYCNGCDVNLSDGNIVQSCMRIKNEIDRI